VGPKDNRATLAQKSENMTVGRDAELGAVERFLDRVAETGGALVLDGEAGIGKTTIWREALARATARPVRVLVARPAEAETALSYAALADLVGGAYDGVRDGLPRPQQRALDIAVLSGESDGPADARTTAVGLLGVLEALAAESPVIVAVDDVQWLDRASERALEFAVRRLPPGVSVLATRRSDGTRDAPLGLRHAVPDERFESVRLGPLSAAALHHIIRVELGAVPSRPILVRIASASGGNPFYALEIARALARQEEEPTRGRHLPIPDNLQELVAARLLGLSPAGREAALVAATLSRPTVPTVVSTLGPQHEAEAAIMEAEEAGVIVAERGRIRFTHPLLASAVYAAASHERRRHLHRRLADVVSDPEERARHLAESTLEANSSIAAEVERAADRASRRGAQDAAAQLYADAARLTPDDRADDAAKRMLGEAASLFAAGDPGGARGVAESALARATTDSLRAEANVLLGEIAWVERPGRQQIDYLEHALGLAADDRRLRGRIHARLSEAWLLDQRRALEHAEAAAALLDEDQDPELLAQALINRFFYGAQLGLEAPRPVLERALRIEERGDANEQRSRLPLMWFSWVDDLEAARARHTFEDRWYRDRGEDGWRAERLGHLAWAELIAGNWEAAERMIEESCATLEQMGLRTGPWGMIWRIRASVDLHRGRVERARETLLRLVEDSEQAGQYFFAAVACSILGSLELVAGDPVAADEAFVTFRAHVDAIGAVAPPGPRSEADHAEALVELGQLERARAVLEHLEWRGRTIPRPWITVAVPRARALVLAAEGDAAAALAELTELDEDAAARVPCEHARTLLVKGRLQRRLKQKRAAADTLGEAVSIFERIGAPLWEQQAQRELERVGLRRAPDELTASERRVAELAASGMTNREVAHAAFMSPKTVEANLGRVYRKLGIRSRAELGARMAAEVEGERSPQT
jgi:DNA-binding CsgD family transcriptional regulator